MTRRMVWAMALGISGALLATTWHSRQQSLGRRPFRRRPTTSGRADPVLEASEESFPASDPPSHTPTTGTRF